MKLKTLLIVCAILSIANTTQAVSKDDLKNRFAQAQAFVKQNPAQVAKVAVGSIATVGGIGFAFKFICHYFNRFCLPDFQENMGLVTLLAGASSGYYMLNDGLNNQPNEHIKSLVQKVKRQVQRTNVNEQK